MSAPPTSADYCTTYLDVTLPSPTRPSLRIGVPRNIPATLLTLPKTHPGRGYRLVGELGSPATWHSCLGVRQCYGGYLEDGNRLFVIFFCFIYGETLCRLIFLMGTLPHPLWYFIKLFLSSQCYPSRVLSMYIKLDVMFCLHPNKMTDLLYFYLLVAPGITSTSWSLLWGVNPTV